MKVIYRNVAENLLCIWIYEDDRKTFVCRVDLKMQPSGSHLVNVHKVVS